MVLPLLLEYLSLFSQMDIHFAPSNLNPYKHNKNKDIGSPWTRIDQQSLHFRYRPTIIYDGFAQCNIHLSKSSRRFSISASKINKGVVKLGDEPAKVFEKRGTIAGAVALIIGTSIGSGILALPQKTSPAGLLPSSITLTVCWAFLVIEALLLVEINVGLMRKRGKRLEQDEFEVISIRTMAQETLGECGGVLATVVYVFLGYSSMIAYNSKSGEIINHLINIPASVSGLLFPVLFAILLSFGGTQATDKVNQWLTASMIVICAYLGGDLQKIRASVLLGSIVPLLTLLLWDAIALSLSSHTNQIVDPVELLISMRWNGASFMVETFSLLATGTSLIGTLLGFSEFFKEQINELSRNSPSIKKQNEQLGLRKWWGENKVSFTAIAMVIAPSLAVSMTVPDAFSAATDIAGGYCMTMLYGVLPPAMAWGMQNENRETKDKTDDKAITTARLALVVVGLFASIIVLEQIFQDLSVLHL